MQQPLAHRPIVQLLLIASGALLAYSSTITIIQPGEQHPIRAVVDEFLVNLTQPVQTLLSQTETTLFQAFAQSTDRLSADELFANGSYAENFNATRGGIIDTLEAIRLENQALRNKARADLEQAMRVLRSYQADNAAYDPEYEHQVIRLAYIYQQYERGYRFVHREYRADVQANYALMFRRGLQTENLTDTADTAHVSYLNIVQKVRRINVANRRDIEEQTEILLRNVAKAMRRIGAEMVERVSVN